MPLLKTFAACCLATPLLCVPAVAQTRFCIGGDLDHLSASQRNACSSTLQSVRQAATALRAPAEWHFVVVCGEEGWKQYTAFVSGNEEKLGQASANTELGQHETYLRERDLEAGDHTALVEIVAHEVAVIQVQRRDELAVRSQATKLLEQSRSTLGL